MKEILLVELFDVRAQLPWVVVIQATLPLRLTIRAVSDVSWPRHRTPM
jgi:hypothetical protein